MEGYITTEEAATILERTPQTLRQWRSGKDKQGPPFYRLRGGRVRYRALELREWLETVIRVDPGAGTGE